MNGTHIARTSTFAAVFAAALAALPGLTGAGLHAAPAAVAQAAQRDPADSLYSAAREALARSDYRRAAELFESVPQRFQRSVFAGDALYWEAFARFRLGTDDDLRRAVRALEHQAMHYPQAATRADAQTLLVRINGALAQRGDAVALEAVTARARAETERLTAELRQMEAEIARVAVEANRRDDARPDSCPEDPEREVRIAALNALMQLDAESALPILAQVLEGDDPCSADLRRSAVFVVSRTRAPQAETLLLKAARDDPDTSVRERAVRSLVSVETETAVAALADILHGGDERPVRTAAIYALSRQPGEQPSRILRAFAARDDVDPELREQAIRAVGRRGEAEDLIFLRDAYRRSSGETKKWILEALGSTRDAETLRWLIGLVLDQAEPIELRGIALSRAGTGGVAIEEMVALYDRVGEKPLKERLISVYSRREETLAVDKLIDIVRNETDIELRRRAIGALARSKDPRVAQVLQEIIGT